MRLALAAALERDELYAVYQPQMTVDGGKVASAEALLRWNRPGIGVIGPDDFVQFAEDNDMIDAIGGFMLDSACRAAARWGDLPVSINVSPAQFARPDLASFVLGIADRAAMPLHRLELEITETAPFGDIDAACATMDLLRLQGVRIALDDLGAGYATASLMQRLPLDRVKLGKSVVDLAATQAGADEVADLIRQALALGLNVTAEGVETQDQLAFVRDCGCDRVQGFFFAKPMSSADLGEFVRATAG